jgi:multidrug transporter EmrE-like cation transporter
VKWLLNQKRFETKLIFLLSLIIFPVFLQAASGICGKYAAMAVKDSSLFVAVTNGFYLLSLIFLVLQAIAWQLTLIIFPLSYAYPFTSLVNFVILIFSAILFQEQITLCNVLGLILISLGILILSRNFGEGT